VTTTTAAAADTTTTTTTTITTTTIWQLVPFFSQTTISLYPKLEAVF